MSLGDLHRALAGAAAHPHRNFGTARPVNIVAPSTPFASFAGGAEPFRNLAARQGSLGRPEVLEDGRARDRAQCARTSAAGKSVYGFGSLMERARVIFPAQRLDGNGAPPSALLRYYEAWSSMNSA